jgi:NADPH:quinone reductase-like Zn-dependent oxidoreductase
MGVRRPRRAIPGGVLAGKVEAVGSDVRRFRIGDRVIASTGLRLGCHAQFTRVREDGVLVLAAPRLNDDENACLVYGGMIALHFLEKGQVHRRHSVLVYGASGAVGTAAVQLAKHFGSHVTAVCSTRNLELVSSLGADAVLDYTSTDALPVDQTFDLVLDAAGRRKTSALKKACEEALAPGGRLVSIDDGLPGFTAERLALLAGIAQAGALRPVIDRRYALDEIVAAHRYVEQGHKRGNVVLTMW